MLNEKIYTQEDLNKAVSNSICEMTEVLKQKDEQLKMFTSSNTKTTVTLREYPSDQDWMEVKRRALITVGKTPVTAPDFDWKMKMLEARHSPIRRLFFSFDIECPSWVSVHLVRHIHAQPYVKSQRNDRQVDYDRNKAPQDAQVSMIWDMNAEELMTIANKRLCRQASKETREVVQMMCDEVIKKFPEFRFELVPACVRQGGVCHEMFPCKKGGQE